MTDLEIDNQVFEADPVTWQESHWSFSSLRKFGASVVSIAALGLLGGNATPVQARPITDYPNFTGHTFDKTGTVGVPEDAPDCPAPFVPEYMPQISSTEDPWRCVVFL